MKECQTWFNIRFINCIRKFCFRPVSEIYITKVWSLIFPFWYQYAPENDHELRDPLQSCNIALSEFSFLFALFVTSLLALRQFQGDDLLNTRT